MNIKELVIKPGDSGPYIKPEGTGPIAGPRGFIGPGPVGI